MLAVFFLLPQSEQVYVSVSIFEVHSGVTALAADASAALVDW